MDRALSDADGECCDDGGAGILGQIISMAVAVLGFGGVALAATLEYRTAAKERQQHEQEKQKAELDQAKQARLDEQRRREVEQVQAEKARLDLQRHELEKCIDKIAIYCGSGKGGTSGDEKPVHRISALGAAIRLRRFFDPESELGGAGRVDVTNNGEQEEVKANYPARAPEGPHRPPYDKKTAPFAKDVANFISAVTRMTKDEYKKTKALTLKPKEKSNEAPEPKLIGKALHKLLVDGLAYAPEGTLVRHDFQYADLNHAYLGFPPAEYPLDVSDADFFRANLCGVSFKAAICKKTVFHSAICDDDTVFHKTNLAEANFKRAICVETWFGEALLDSAIFDNAVLDKAGFHGAVLDKAGFKKASLVGICFKRAKITECKFEDANLLGADFTEATLKACSFVKADIRGCNLGTANIDDVTSWAGAIYDDHTRFPDGFEPEDKQLKKGGTLSETSHSKDVVS